MLKRKTKPKLKKAPAVKAAAQRKKTMAQKKKAAASNKQAQWKTFRDLKAKINKNLAKLKKDYKKEVRPEVLHEDLRHLTLLGGEVHYMLLELEKMKKAASPKKRAAPKKRHKKPAARRKAKK